MGSVDWGLGCASSPGRRRDNELGRWSRIACHFPVSHDIASRRSESRVRQRKTKKGLVLHCKACEVMVTRVR